MKRLFVFTTLLLAAPALWACKCVQEPVSEKTIAPYDFIFYGKVIATSGCDGTSRVKFLVEELYRGSSYGSTELEYDCSSDCQMSFSPDEDWLIYASFTGFDKGKVEFCSYSRMQPGAGEEDFNTVNHGMDFKTEKAWLQSKLGVKPLKEREVVEQQHHENLKPQGMNVIWMMAIGFGTLALFYFITRKFLR